ncbi:MAG: hypothetical protein H6Q16_842 [Bacteroidetes bacterium]|nr:hypothetical protein [Bacteroidota bacterium]
MESNEKCLCNTGSFNVVCCSGASDLGHLSDIIARKLSSNKVRRMNCLAVIANGNTSLIETYKQANVLAIDGCSGDCSKKILERARITDFNHLRLSDLNYKKGETPTNEEEIDSIYEIAKNI